MCVTVSSLPNKGANKFTSVAKKERTNSDGSALSRCAVGTITSTKAVFFRWRHTEDRCEAAAPFTYTETNDKTK